jgi:hypothetical protein
MVCPHRAVPQQADDSGFGFNVHAGKRLIEQDHRPAGQSPAPETRVSLPAGELANLPMAQLKHIHPFQRVGDDLPIQRFGRRSQPIWP